MSREHIEDASDLIVPPDEPPAMDSGFRRTLMERLVARAMPPNLMDPDQERVAEAAAESAIRQVGKIAAIAGVVLLVLFGVLLYYVAVSSRTTALAQTSRITALEAERAQMREANAGLQQQLAQAIKRQTVLRGEAAAFHSQVDALTQQLQQVRTLAAQKQQAKPTSPPGKSGSQAPTSTSANLRPQPTTAPKR
jgi:hypothetical protein